MFLRVAWRWGWGCIDKWVDKVFYRDGSKLNVSSAPAMRTRPRFLDLTFSNVNPASLSAGHWATRMHGPHLCITTQGDTGLCTPQCAESRVGGRISTGPDLPADPHTPWGKGRRSFLDLPYDLDHEGVHEVTPSVGRFPGGKSTHRCAKAFLLREIRGVLSVYGKGTAEGKGCVSTPRGTPASKHF